MRSLFTNFDTIDITSTIKNLEILVVIYVYRSSNRS